MIDARQFDPRKLDELTRRITALLPASMQTLQQDLERQVRSVLQQGIERMDLVTREDFEVQGSILHRTQAQLLELERRVAALEGGPRVDDREASDIT